MRLKLLICFLVVGSILQASSQTLDVPEFSTRVIDKTGTLSTNDIQRLESTLANFEHETSNQIVVLMIPSLEGESLEDFSFRVAEKNKFGKKERNNGVILLVVKDDRKLRIEVGYGLEGALTDALSSQIIRREITPQFRQGDYYAGIAAGIEAIMAATKGEYKADEQDGKKHGFPFAPLFIIFIPILFLMRLFSAGRRHYIGRSGYFGGGPWWWGGGGMGGGGFGGGGFGGGGGFSGGGGSFGGGGASGSW